MNANELKARMVLKGINAKALCAMIGISDCSWYRKLNGKTEFTQGEISAIAKALDMTKDDVFAVFFAA